jgi:hypothetical protein
VDWRPGPDELSRTSSRSLPSGILGLGPGFCCSRDAMHVYGAGFVAEASVPRGDRSETAGGARKS